MRTRRALAAFSILTLALLAIATGASAAQTTIHIPADQPTIQAGIDAAHNGDTVLVSPGTYYENIDFKGKAITVTSSGGSAVTIIDGNSKGPAVTFKTSETRSSILSNLTIQNGGNFYTEGSPSTPYVAESPGIEINTAAPTLLNNIITSNNCWGIRNDNGAPLIQGNEISQTQDPHGLCSFGGGAGIYIGGNLNYAPSGNTATEAVIAGNTIENNIESGKEDAGGNGGAAIAVWGGSPFIENNILRNNASPGGSGGAINIEGGTGTAVVQNLIYGNTAGCGGGGIAFNQFGIFTTLQILIANNTIVNNIDYGPGGYSECTNISQIYPDPQSYGDSSPTAVIINNIISGDTSYPAINCVQFYAPSEWYQPVFDHNILHNAGGAFFGPQCIDVSAKYGNISADPDFLNAAADDFRLSINSPAIDNGNNSALQLIQQTTGVQVKQDFATDLRVQDATAKGYPVIDIGAYEFLGLSDAAPTTILLAPLMYTGNPGPFTFVLTATLSSSLGVPSGAVTFYLDGNSVGSSSIDASGIATFSSFSFTPGIHNLYASYAGQGSFPPAISPVVFANINKYATNLSLTSSANPSILGQPVTFTINASSADSSYLPAPISLTDQSTNSILASLTPNASGIAIYSTNSMTLGSHPIVASYAGDSSHAAATAFVNQQVVSGYSTSTSLTSSLNPALYGQSVTFTATVTNTSTTPGSPTGSIAFSDGSTILATQSLTASGANSATATFSTGTLSVGTHPITATYIPSGTFAASTGSLSQVVTGLSTTASLASSLNPASVGQSVTFTASVANTSTTSGTPTGSITFSDGGTVLASQPVIAAGINSATASFSTSALSAGTHSITATYVPSSGFSASSAQIQQTVYGQASVTMFTATPNPTFFGTTVTLTAAVSGASGTPTGSIAFYDAGAIFATISLNTSGQATVTTSSLAVGTHTLTAVYSGDSTYAASTSAPFTEVIQPLPQDFTITLASPSITIQAQHHATTSLTLASVNGFADSLAIACANLPQYVTCQPTPTPASLAANGAATVSLYLDTDSVLGYAHLAKPMPPARRSAPISLALLLSPFSLFGALAFSRKFRRVPLRLIALLIALLPIQLALSGCTTIIEPYDPPPFATPGTYTIPITATGAATHTSHTANLTLTITP